MCFLSCFFLKHFGPRARLTIAPKRAGIHRRPLAATGRCLVESVAVSPLVTRIPSRHRITLRTVTARRRRTITGRRQRGPSGLLLENPIRDDRQECELHRFFRFFWGGAFRLAAFERIRFPMRTLC